MLMPSLALASPVPVGVPAAPPGMDPESQEPGGFSSILALGTGDSGEAEPDVRAQAGPAAIEPGNPATGKAPGKAGGKILPVPLPLDELPGEPASLAVPEDEGEAPVEGAPDIAALPVALLGAPETLAAPQKPVAQIAVGPARAKQALLSAPAVADGQASRGGAEPETQPDNPVRPASANGNAAIRAQEQGALPAIAAFRTRLQVSKADAPGPAHAPQAATAAPRPQQAGEVPLAHRRDTAPAVDTAHPEKPDTARTPAVASLSRRAAPSRPLAPETAAPAQPVARSEAVIIETAGITGSDLQPVITMREAQTASPTVSAAPAGLRAASDAAAPHDFTALVDRLVAARDASGADAVRTAIAHTDFGQVSLSFRRDDGRIAVQMASADPGFAPAAQAAAAAGQSAMTGGDTSTPQRQDGQHAQHQQAATAQGQNAAQGQSDAASQGQGGARGGMSVSATGTDAGGDARTGGGEPGSPRDHGIYA